MNRNIFIIGLAVLMLCACTARSGEQNSVENLVVTDGENEVLYSVDDLKKLGEVEEEFMGEIYLGVPLPDLLGAAGFGMDSIKSVKAVAADGYSVLYDATLFTREDVLVAYALSEGPLSNDDGMFRMVLPGEEGKLNLRILVEIFVENK